jgi:glycosyltransferase involved in cell wall biosynthesis
MQPLRFIKRIPSSLFIRADTIENHRLKGRPPLLLVLERCLEGFGISNVRCFGVSQTLINSIASRHSYFKPKCNKILRNDITRWSPDNTSSLFKVASPLRLACVGILEKRKNQAFILEVFAKLDSHKAQLYFYGVGPEEEKLKQVVEQKHLSQNVHFMGWVETAWIWQNVDILLMPSLHEGASNAILEALEIGISIFASDIPEHREMLPERNLLPIHDSQAWVDRLEKVLQKPEIELKRIVNSQLPYAQHLYFDWDEKICKLILES